MLNAKKVLEIARKGFQDKLFICYEDIIELCEKEIAETSLKERKETLIAPIVALLAQHIDDEYFEDVEHIKEFKELINDVFKGFEEHTGGLGITEFDEDYYELRNFMSEDVYLANRGSGLEVFFSHQLI